MTREEAADLLAVAKHVMPWVEAGAAERYEMKLRCGLSIEEAHQLADLVLPRGRAEDAFVAPLVNYDGVLRYLRIATVPLISTL